MPIKLSAVLTTVLAVASPAFAQTPPSGSTAARSVTLGDGSAALHGTLLPAVGTARPPAVLIIAGSGPTDRDGNNPLGVRAQTYKLLAEGLAARGVTTLRFDKRGIAASASAAAKEEDLRFETYVDDAKAWASKLKREAGTSCVWLLGHSEGALVAQAAARNNAEVCGLMLVAGAGRKAADIIRQQLSAALPEAARAPAFAALTELEAGRTVASPPPPAALFRASVQPYLISWFKYDPTKLLGAYKSPVLILHGSTDIQAMTVDADRLAAANPKAKRVELQGVNHVLKTAPLDRAANLATYGDPDLPLAPGVVDALADFVLGRPQR